MFVQVCLMACVSPSGNNSMHSTVHPPWNSMHAGPLQDGAMHTKLHVHAPLLVPTHEAGKA